MLQSCLGCLLFATLAFAASAQAGKDPKNATEWFQRADDQMYLRAPGSTPFHMKVAFRALPSIVLDKEESSQIISGDGTYEETWVAPKRWRREVTLGSITPLRRSPRPREKCRPVQTTSQAEYSCSLGPCCIPFPATCPRRRSVRGTRSGRLKTARSAACPMQGSAAPQAHRMSSTLISFYPVQSVEVGIVTSWQDQTSFGGKLVPQHFKVQGGTRDLLTAQVTVEPVGTVNPAAFELPGEPAEPGTTLRPIHAHEYSLSLPMTTYSWGGQPGSD